MQIENYKNQTCNGNDMEIYMVLLSIVYFWMNLFLIMKYLLVHVIICIITKF